MADKKVELRVNGKAYGGWTSVSVSRSLKAVSGKFDLEVIDRWTGQNQAWEIVPGDECSVRIGSDTLVTGYVDQVAPSFDAESRSISISGRDKTADLVDCSVDLANTQINNVKLDRLAKLLAAPLGITVKSETDVGAAFPSFAIQPGEQAFAALERAARLRGVLVTSDGLGGLLLTRPSSGRSYTALEQGKNILSGSATFDHSERFSKYKVLGQRSGQGSSASEDDLNIDFDLGLLATATDANVKRTRVKTILAEGPISLAAAKKRAQWEATFAAAKSSNFEITVRGWFQGDGSLWRVNQQVPLKSPWLRADQAFLCSGVVYRYDDGGEVCTLSLERPDAYTPSPEQQTKKGIEPWKEFEKK